MSIAIPKKVVILVGLLEILLVYLTFARILGTFNVALPLGGMDLGVLMAGLAICTTIIANQLWNKQKNKPVTS